MNRKSRRIRLLYRACWSWSHPRHWQRRRRPGRARCFRGGCLRRCGSCTSCGVFPHWRAGLLLLLRRSRWSRRLWRCPLGCSGWTLSGWGSRRSRTLRSFWPAARGRGHPHPPSLPSCPWCPCRTRCCCPPPSSPPFSWGEGPSACPPSPCRPPCTCRRANHPIRPRRGRSYFWRGWWWRWWWRRWRRGRRRRWCLSGSSGWRSFPFKFDSDCKINTD